MTLPACAFRKKPWQARSNSQKMQPAANDPSIDPVLTLVLRYIPPVALIGMAFALSAIAWALSL